MTGEAGWFHLLVRRRDRGRIRGVFARGGDIFSNLTKRSQVGWLGRTKDIRFEDSKRLEAWKGVESGNV